MMITGVSGTLVHGCIQPTIPEAAAMPELAAVQ
jgi:hypothetical protein